MSIKTEIVFDPKGVLDEILNRVQGNMEQALLDAAEATKLVWLHRAQMKGIRSQEYLEGIRTATVKIESIVKSDRATVGSVRITNRASNAAVIEEGHGPFHLPSRIKWPTPKTKVSKTGTRYIDVPFRHFAYTSKAEQIRKGYHERSKRHMMPKDVYEYAKRLGRTVRRNLGPQYDSKGNYVAADQYSKAGRTRLGHRDTLTAMGVPGLPSIYHGMIRTGPVGHTQYLTIRRLTERSRGWNIPAKEGKHVARDVAVVLPQVLPSVIEAAVGLGDE